MSYLEAYLDALPEAEASYPDHVQKASVYRQFLEMTPMDGIAEVLPAAVRPLITEPVPVSAWVPEVHITALYVAARDVAFPDDASYLAHWHEVNRALLKGRLYRMLMKVASPTVVIRGAGSRWRSFHRGVGLHLDQLERGALAARLVFPPHLIPEVLAGSYAGALQAALEVAGAKQAHLEPAGYTPTEIRITGHWG